MKISTKYKCDKCGKEFEIPVNKSIEGVNGSLCTECYMLNKQEKPEITFRRAVDILEIANQFCFDQGRIYLAEDIKKAIYYLKYINTGYDKLIKEKEKI